MTVQDESTTTHGAVLTDAAATKAKSLLDQEGRDDLALRIAVQPGGIQRPVGRHDPARVRRRLVAVGTSGQHGHGAK